MQIAIVGAGIAGLTAAFLLQEQGHTVTIFEQANRCGPVGAGFILQSSGQHVLEALSLLDPLLQSSVKLSGIRAFQRSGRTLVDLRYAKLSPELFGLGVRRSELFRLLYERCQRASVEIIEDAYISSVQNGIDRVDVTYKDKKRSFDIAIAADGSRSAIRLSEFPDTAVKEYSYAALWALVPTPVVRDELWQMVEGTSRLVGLLPVAEGISSFFWGIHVAEKESIWQRGIEQWKREVSDFSPSLEPVVATFGSLDELTYSTYRHALLKTFYQGRIVFIGDAAHASSPHLGQGVNLALEDALTLANCLSFNPDFSEAFREYEKTRKPVAAYYSYLTAFLTPFFQSQSPLLGLGRDIFLPILPHLPWVGKEMVKSMAGLKRGWLS